MASAHRLQMWPRDVSTFSVTVRQQRGQRSPSATETTMDSSSSSAPVDVSTFDTINNSASWSAYLFIKLDSSEDSGTEIFRAASTDFPISFRVRISSSFSFTGSLNSRSFSISPAVVALRHESGTTGMGGNHCRPFIQRCPEPVRVTQGLILAPEAEFVAHMAEKRESQCG
jgi:hypothetical protein